MKKKVTVTVSKRKVTVTVSVSNEHYDKLRKMWFRESLTQLSTGAVFLKTENLTNPDLPSGGNYWTEEELDSLTSLWLALKEKIK